MYKPVQRKSKCCQPKGKQQFKYILQDSNCYFFIFKRLTFLKAKAEIAFIGVRVCFLGLFSSLRFSTVINKICYLITFSTVRPVKDVKCQTFEKILSIWRLRMCRYV